MAINSQLLTVQILKNDVQVLIVCLSYFITTVTRVLSYFQEFACNGVVIEHPEYGEVLQLQGDQRTKVCAWLSNPKIGLVRADQLKVHGF